MPLEGASATSYRCCLVRKMHSHLKEVYDTVLARDPNQPEFHQAVLEILESLDPVVEAHPEFITSKPFFHSVK